MPTWPIPPIGSPVPRRAIELTTDIYDSRIDFWEFFRHSDELTGGYTASVKTYRNAETPPAFVESYLVPHEKEDSTEFSRRVSLATPPRFVQEGITSITGVLTAQPPNRNEYPEELAEWMNAVTVEGASWQQFVATDVVPLVERYGVVYTLARRPSIGGQTEGDRQRAIEDRGLPEVLVHVITPEALKWWHEDDVGQLEIVRYVEIITENKYDDTNTYVIDSVDVERNWWITREGWWYCDNKKEGSVAEDESTELIVLDSGMWDESGEMDNFPVVKWKLKDELPPTETASMAQVAYYRAESELKKIEESAAFPMVWVPVEAADSNPTEVVKGPDVVGAFPADGTKQPFMLEPSGISFDHYVMNRLPELEEQALSPYGRQREVGGNDSGVALAHIQETAKNIWRQHAKALGLAEFNALQPIAELLGVELPVEIRADWPAQFGVLADAKQMENVQIFLDMQPGPEFSKCAIATAADVVCPNMTQTERDKAMDAYDTEQEEKKAFEAEQADLFAMEAGSGDNGDGPPKPFAANPASAAGPEKER